jgi:hypothetical protein
MSRTLQRRHLAAIIPTVAVLLILTQVQCGNSCTGGAYAGLYQGTWGSQGSETGTWEVMVDTCGAINGSGDNGAFAISGTVDGSGRMKFGATKPGSSTTASFTGTIEGPGSVSGTWSSSLSGGTFHGKLVAIP